MYSLSTGTDDASIAMKCGNMEQAEALLEADKTVKLMSDADIANL